jgi:hypothetical protein
MRLKFRRLAFLRRTRARQREWKHYINDNAPFVTTKYYGQTIFQVSGATITGDDLRQFRARAG